MCFWCNQTSMFLTGLQYHLSLAIQVRSLSSKILMVRTEFRLDPEPNRPKSDGLRNKSKPRIGEFPWNRDPFWYALRSQWEMKGVTQRKPPKRVGTQIFDLSMGALWFCPASWVIGCYSDLVCSLKMHWSQGHQHGLTNASNNVDTLEDGLDRRAALASLPLSLVGAMHLGPTNRISIWYIWSIRSKGTLKLFNMQQSTQMDFCFPLRDFAVRGIWQWPWPLQQQQLGCLKSRLAIGIKIDVQTKGTILSYSIYFLPLWSCLLGGSRQLLWHCVSFWVPRGKHDFYSTSCEMWFIFALLFDEAEHAAFSAWSWRV